ncbi:hypothetical protein [Paenibacillus sp. PAMC21692]|uniref:hypothetical protein n=1 Tax=Paenibacillus sp. PAMC21692 TaxID=2762320 RepID=UPI00164DC691|nr:hypothetical protein [Paenibacillus sp. PAMC21692]QNK56773.1 hypothetical protein H7F31_30350 [Paenibacillus sp. PAMC21692]
MTQPTATKLSQWDALQLESLKSLGWSNEELISRVNSGDLPKDDSKFQFDYAGLRTVASEEPDTLKAAVESGYQIKYNTIRGIHSWILVALKQDAELILDPGSEAVAASLTAAEAASLAGVLSFGWALTAVDDAGTAGADGRTAYRVSPAG